MTIPLDFTRHRRLFTTTFLVVAISSLFTCHRVTAAEKTDSVIEATVGQEFTISLASNPSTGYSWQLAKPLDQTIVKSVKEDYQTPPRKAGEPPKPGSGGNTIWTFKAVKSGKTVIKLIYVRPWEKDQPPANTASYQVVVK